MFETKREKNTAEVEQLEMQDYPLQTRSSTLIAGEIGGGGD
jgi:hypothetical protein